MKKIQGLALCVLAAGMLAACSNETKIVEDPMNAERQPEFTGLSLVKTPDVKMWSGSQVLGTTRADGDEDATDETTEGAADEKNPIVHNQEVEVNLSIDDSHDYEIADIITKLSIHVRTATNVTVTMPVPSKYVCESDDLVIFEQHDPETSGYGGSLEDLMSNLSSEVTYNVGGTDVTLHVDFLTDGEGSIMVWTDGIDETVLAYCFATYGDGINFEIWNYYQTAEKDFSDPSLPNGELKSTLTREALKGMLDGSTVSFTYDPKYYINGFGWDYTGSVDGKEHGDTVNPWDCTVDPVSGYTEGPTTDHLNGTPFNVIWYLDGTEEKDIDDAHVAHNGTVTPDSPDEPEEPAEEPETPNQEEEE